MAEKQKTKSGFIASRERKKEFDAAVKEVMRQRKAAQAAQNAARQQKRRPTLTREASGTRNLMAAADAGTDNTPNTMTRDRALIRRATVAHGSAPDLAQLQKSRAQAAGNSNEAVIRRWQSTKAAISRQHQRASTGDISDRDTPPSSSLNTNNNTRGGDGGGGDMHDRLHPSSKASSMTTSDEIKREVEKAINEKEGGDSISYVPVSGKRVVSQPLLSYILTEALTASKEPSSKRNDSRNLTTEDQTVNPLCGLEGIKLEDLVPTRKMPTPPSSSRNNALDKSDTSGRSSGRHENNENVNLWKTKKLMMSPAQIDFDLGKSTSDEDSPKGQAIYAASSPSTPAAVKDGNSSQPRPSSPIDCPRKKFVFLSSQAVSQSEGTGKTSKGSLFSSIGSIGGANVSSAALKEKGRKRPPLGEGDEHSLQSTTSSKFSLRSLKNRASRRSRRLSQIRLSISKSLGGDAAENMDTSEHKNEDVISGSQRSERVRAHLLDRKNSTQSVTSAYSTNTATSTTKNDNRQPGWRFRLRHGMAKHQSTSAITVERNRRYSNVSRGSIDSGWLDDDSSSNSSFTDFYDSDLHAGLMRSMISRTSSTKSMPLPTVVEGGQKGENVVEEEKCEETADDDASQILPKDEIDTSARSDATEDSLYRHPAHSHPLLHMRPNQLFPDSPGWQCDLCTQDTFDLNQWAYVSTERNYLLCEKCFSQDGVPILATN